MQTFLSRRTLLALGGATVLAQAASAGTAAGFLDRKKLTLGVQLYALGEELGKDFEGTLAKVAAIGYRNVELAGFNGRSARQLRDAFSNAGLVCTSAHIPMTAVFPGQGPTLGDPERLIEDAHVLGLKYIVLPMFPLPRSTGPPQPGADMISYIKRAGGLMTAADWYATADLLNKMGERLGAAGLTMAYHNHNFEFAPLGGRTGFDILLERTEAKLVRFELDAGWAAAAGQDPIAIVTRHPGRFELMHVKDIKSSTKPNFSLQQDPVEVGSGMINWRRLLPAAYSAGVRHFIVEQEPPYTQSRIDAISQSFRYLKQLRT